MLFKQACISCKLLQACKYDLESAALEILEFGNIDYNYVDKNGDTALIWACTNNMDSIALKILEKEDINYKHLNNDKQTALILACKNNVNIIVYESYH